jgi:hypothetical protein
MREDIITNSSNILYRFVNHGPLLGHEETRKRVRSAAVFLANFSTAQHHDSTPEFISELRKIAREMRDWPDLEDQAGDVLHIARTLQVQLGW